ncbi:MAG: GNAT family N-acetyltransferase [bacterium]|nr:GNAT family N-acetyltransferase [bacterium]
MMELNTIVIRNYQPIDRESVRRISCMTAFLEEPHNLFIDNEDILADILTRYFTDYEPESCFVAMDNPRVVGYLIGSTDIRKVRIGYLKRILPNVIVRGIKTGTIFHGNTVRLLWHIFLSLMKGEFRIPDYSKEYPATLHINLDKQYRGRNIGSKLLGYYITYLKSNNIPGVHFGTVSESAKLFFQKMGFELLYSTKLTCLHYHFGYDLPYYIFGKKL